MSQALVAATEHAVGTGGDERVGTLERGFGALAQDRNDRATALGRELTRLADELKGNRSHRALGARLRKDPDVVENRKIDRVGRDALLDGDRAHRAGVDAAAAEHAGIGRTCKAMRALPFDHDAAVRARAHAASAADAGLGIDDKSGHYSTSPMI